MLLFKLLFKCNKVTFWQAAAVIIIGVCKNAFIFMQQKEFSLLRRKKQLPVRQ
jgi:hypothetical protein